MKKYNILSLFSGAGGFDVGFHGGFNYLGKIYEHLPFTTKYFIEINESACETLKLNFGDGEIINGDVNEIDFKSFNGEIDVVIGGFPCVSFSTIGNRKGIKDDINGMLFKRLAESVRDTKPKVFVAENVKGLLSSNGGEDFDFIYNEFVKLGYRVKAKLIDFSDYGVPQKRERLIFVGVRNDIDTSYEFPYKSIHEEYEKIGSLAAIKDVPNINNEVTSISTNDKFVISHVLEGMNWKCLPDDIIKNNVSGKFSNVFRRLDRYKPSHTIVASDRNPIYHFGENRALTNRELARLQSFHDWFVFCGTTREIKRQIGNAVPPVGAWYIAKSLLGVLK